MPSEIQELRRSRAIATSAARITAFAAGAALLSAACDTYNPAAPGQDLNVPAEIQVSAEEFSLRPGESTQLTGEVFNSDGDTIDAEISWSSSDTAVARVDEGGMVTANNPGEANISAEAGDAEASLLMLVLQHIPAEIQLIADRDTLDPAERTQITAVVLSAGGDTIETELTWSSDSVIVAQVDDEGIVTPRNSGEVSITAATRDVEGSISLYIPPPLRFTEISAGRSDTCALTEDGATYCWGVVTDADIPTRVAHDFVFEQITAKNRTACGLTSAGDAYCWGENVYYRIGESVPYEVDEPVRIDHPIPFRYIDLGEHGGMCAIEETGTLVCWGHNDFGQVGRGTVSAYETERLPVAVDALFTDVDLGAFRGCGIAEDGQGYCWGQYAWGIGDGVDPSQVDWEEVEGVQPPLELAGDLNLSSVASGIYFSCAVAVDNRGYCWGKGYKLGTGDNEDRWAPAEISEHRFSSIAAGFDHACGVTTDAQALCWGSGGGRLGTGDDESSYLPRAVAGEIEFRQLSTGPGHTCGVSSLGVIYCWGGGHLGRADMENSNVPVPVEWPADVGVN